MERYQPWLRNVEFDDDGAEGDFPLEDGIAKKAEGFDGLNEVPLTCQNRGTTQVVAFFAVSFHQDGQGSLKKANTYTHVF